MKRKDLQMMIGASIKWGLILIGLRLIVVGIHQGILKISTMELFQMKILEGAFLVINTVMHIMITARIIVNERYQSKELFSTRWRELLQCYIANGLCLILFFLPHGMLMAVMGMLISWILSNENIKLLKFLVPIKQWNNSYSKENIHLN